MIFSSILGDVATQPGTFVPGAIGTGGPIDPDVSDIINVTDEIIFTIARRMVMSNAAKFPGTVWDGSSASRKNPDANNQTPLEVYREPDANDWQQIQNEMIEVETLLQTNTTTLRTTTLIAGASNTAAIATTATGGFGHLPTCAGTPTGVPLLIPTGYVPCVYDTTAHKLWVYDGSWVATSALT